MSLWEYTVWRTLLQFVVIHSLEDTAPDNLVTGTVCPWAHWDGL